MRLRRWHKVAMAFLVIFALVFFALNQGITRQLEEEEENKKLVDLSTKEYGEERCTTKQLEEEEENNGKLLVDLFTKKYGDERILEKSICLIDGTCVDIVDRIGSDGKKPAIVREIGYDTIRLTTLLLKTPFDLTEEKMDTANWRIDKRTPRFDIYIATMIEEMFTSGAISMNRKVSATVLSLGLGGGHLNSYLHHNYRNLNITVVEYDPQMLNISENWCDLQLDEMHRVIIADGTEFVKKCADEGEKFDVIFLDACTADHSSIFICPAKKFVAANPANDLASILKSNGVLIVNVLGNRQTFSEAPKELLRIYGAAFKHCIFKKSHSPSNLVMTCAQYPIEKNLREMYEGFANYSKYGAHVSEEWSLP